MKHSLTIGADYSGSNTTIAIVSARFNGEIVEAMRVAAYETLLDNGVDKVNIKHIYVPGAFELPLACKTLAASKEYDAVIALGCVIRGDTPHFNYVCSSSAQGIQQACLETNTPIAFGVLNFILASTISFPIDTNIIKPTASIVVPQITNGVAIILP